MSTNLIVLIIVGVVLFAWIISVYNSLIAMIEAVANNMRQIDIQLDRRFKVLQSLIETVKKAMDFEKTTLKDVVELRNQAQSARKSGDELLLKIVSLKLQAALMLCLNNIQILKQIKMPCNCKKKLLIQKIN